MRQTCPGPVHVKGCQYSFFTSQLAESMVCSPPCHQICAQQKHSSVETSSFEQWNVFNKDFRHRYPSASFEALTKLQLQASKLCSHPKRGQPAKPQQAEWVTGHSQSIGPSTLQQ